MIKALSKVLDVQDFSLPKKRGHPRKNKGKSKDRQARSPICMFGLLVVCLVQVVWLLLCWLLVLSSLAVSSSCYAYLGVCWLVFRCVRLVFVLLFCCFFVLCFVSVFVCSSPLWRVLSTFYLSKDIYIWKESSERNG